MRDAKSQSPVLAKDRKSTDGRKPAIERKGSTSKREGSKTTEKVRMLVVF